MSSPVPLPILSAAPPDKPLPGLSGLPLLRLGFRPFYLGAALFALLALPLWVALYLGHLSVPLALPPLLWHAHEMLYGFAAAVIVGFLLTAGKAWTGLSTPRGPVLGALALLWAAARVAGVMAPSAADSSTGYAAYAVLDLLLLPLVAGALAVVLVRAGSRRNLPLVAIVLLLASTNGAFHLAVAGAIALSPLTALHAGLALIVMLQCVIAGRVVPAFTASAMPGSQKRAWPALEVAVLAVTALALLLWVGGATGVVTGGALALASVLHVARQWRWQPWVTRRRPILWILHAAYAWLAVGFALLALAQFGAVGTSAGVHALAVGATGGLIIGMITRTARGHTGRPLQASALETAAYALVMAAALLRVVLPLLAPQWLPQLLVGAAAAWCAAFAIYLVIYTPWLLRTRRDGKDG